MHKAFDLPLDRFLHVSCPLLYRNMQPGQTEQGFSSVLARELDELIEAEGADTVAAFFAEPVMGAGGLVPSPKGYFEAIQPVLEKHDVLLVADEVVTGFGRLGTYWGSERVNMQPDLMTVAKGITSGYFPMSGCFVSEAIWEVLKDAPPEFNYFSHGYTYSAHPVGAAAALANLEIIEGEDLVRHAWSIGEKLQASIREAFSGHPLVGNIRGLGLLAGIELVADKSDNTPFPVENTVGKQLYSILLDRGLISRALGDTLVFSPALIVTETEITEILDKFSEGLDELTHRLRL
jgi:L-2,4-diaminobutyrate transaminase